MTTFDLVRWLPPSPHMVILTFISYSVQEYLAVCYDLWDDLLQTLICPDCKCVFKKHQVRLRSAWEDCEHAQRIPILCIVCPKCRKFSTVLPDFLKPHSRYITPVREAVVTGEVAAPPCDERTARRWRASFSSKRIIGDSFHCSLFTSCHLSSSCQHSRPASRRSSAFTRIKSSPKYGASMG